MENYGSHFTYQLGTNTPLNLGITPEEMFRLAPEFKKGATSFKSLIGNVKPTFECENKRTGFTCRLVDIQTESSFSEPAMAEYIVELKTDVGFIYAQWECLLSDRATDRLLRDAADKTFIAWSALIGVRVGYQLTVNAPH